MLLSSPHAAAEMVRRSSALAAGLDGIVGVYFAEDLPGGDGLDLLAGETIEYPGQAVALVVGLNVESCLEALGKIEVEFHPLPAILDVAHAKAVRNVEGVERCLERGDAGRAVREGEVLVEGSFSIGSQYPGSCGILGATALPADKGTGVQVEVPAERPSEVRREVARVLGLPESLVSIKGMPVSGCSGGRGDESVRVACLAAFAAMRLGKSVYLELNNDQERELTGKRHAVEVGFRACCDKSGVIAAVDIQLVMDAGCGVGSGGSRGQVALERAILSVDGVYGIDDFRVKGRLCHTNGLTGDSIAAEGSVQGILVVEEIISHVARKLGKSADTIREVNFYRSKKGAVTTCYGQQVDADILGRLWISILSSSNLHQRREEIEKWNHQSQARKRGIAAILVKMGVGDFDATHNQASAWVQLLPDGSVRVWHSQVDIGDGLDLRIKRQIKGIFGVEEKRIKVSGGEDGRLSPSSKVFGIDGPALVREAVEDACDQLGTRLGKGIGSGEDDSRDTFTERVAAAGIAGENLMAIGFSTQVDKEWGHRQLSGSPFAGYFLGGAVIEVELDAFSGEVCVLRADLFCEGRESEFTDLDRAQISRAYMMGQGWMFSEDVNAHPYAMPALEDAPADFRIESIELGQRGKENLPTVSCAEAPVAMAVAAREALREAILAYAPGSGIDIELPVPAGPPVVIRALAELSRKVQAMGRKRKMTGKAG